MRPSSRTPIDSESRPALRHSSARGTKNLDPGARSTRFFRSRMRASRSGMKPQTKPPPGGGGRSRRRRANHGPTVVAALPVLFAGFGSGVVGDVAVAVFEIVVPAPAVTFATIVTVTAPPGPMSPTVAVTVSFVPGFPLHVPMLATQETKVVPFGSGSILPTFAAIAG